MRKAFIDPVTNILVAHGLMDTNNADTPIEVAADFDLEPNRWRRQGNGWVAVPPPPPRQVPIVKIPTDTINSVPALRTVVADVVQVLQDAGLMKES